MVDSRDKGARAETDVKKFLRDKTGLNWERVPGSGALNEKHGLKADLYVPNEKNLYCVEVKHYADDYLTSQILTSKSPQFFVWWEQAVRQGKQVNKKPLLIFKFDRSKLFVATEDMPCADYQFMYLSAKGYEVYVSLLEDFLVNECPKFIA